jgi:hypothetical protein
LDVVVVSHFVFLYFDFGNLQINFLILLLIIHLLKIQLVCYQTQNVTQQQHPTELTYIGEAA